MRGKEQTHGGVTNHLPLIENRAAVGRRITLFAYRPIPEITAFKAPMASLTQSVLFLYEFCWARDMKSLELNKAFKQRIDPFPSILLYFVPQYHKLPTKSVG